MSDKPKITLMPGSMPDIDTMMAVMREEVPGARRGIVVVFDDEGTIHIRWSCNLQQMSFASLRLAHIVNREGTINAEQ